MPSEIDTRPDDLIQPFRIDPFALRGRLVRLGPTVDRILSQHDYPEPVAAILGEAITLGRRAVGHAQIRRRLYVADQERRAGQADRRRCLDRGRGARLCAIRPRPARSGAGARDPEVGRQPVGAGADRLRLYRVHGRSGRAYRALSGHRRAGRRRTSPNARSIISGNPSRSRPASNCRWRARARTARGGPAG